MTPETWWQSRVEGARALMKQSVVDEFGGLDRTEPRLAAALHDAVSRPGSLVRATICYLTGMVAGMDEEHAKALGCGIEYLHTASLVFDDLPAMDDAHARRGSACLHIVHGEAVAMLAALALVNRGYTLLWKGMSFANGLRRAMAGGWVDARLGVGGVLGGQAYDLAGWSGAQTTAEVSAVAARKTGDMLRLALVLPAIVGRGTSREIRLLDRLALLRGLAYQAADDLKDVVSTPMESGKTAGRDAALGRPNLVAAEGLQAAKRRFERLDLMGDRIQALLPGASDRWGMLDLLKVRPPAVDDAGEFLNAAV